MKKYKLSIYTLAALAAVASFSSCKKELEQTNKNPNNAETPNPTTLLSNTIASEWFNNANIAWTLGNGYGQYMTFSSDYYNTPTRYQPVSNAPYWTVLFESARDANIILNIATQQKNPALQAIALTLRSYAFAQLTELWGDIPFKDALRAATKTIYDAKYDGQEVVYNDAEDGVLPSLKKAADLMASAGTSKVTGDILFKGNTTSWAKLINTLRLRYLLRVSAKQDVAAEMQAIVNSGVLMQNASESATYLLPSVLPYSFPSLIERSGDFQVKFMNQTLYQNLKNTNDVQRIKSYFAPNVQGATATQFSFDNYGGMPLVENASEADVKSSSNFGSNFLNYSHTPFVSARCITYAEQEFILAEAALKNLVNGGSSVAESHYVNGVKGAFDELKLTGADIYLTQTEVQFNADDITAAMQKIITQKWLSNINNGFEGWIEYKRTGFPSLAKGGIANMNGGKIPLRFLYPVDEQSINATNYKTELQKMGGKDDTNFKAWW